MESDNIFEFLDRNSDHITLLEDSANGDTFQFGIYFKIEGIRANFFA